MSDPIDVEAEKRMRWRYMGGECEPCDDIFAEGMRYAAKLIEERVAHEEGESFAKDIIRDARNWLPGWRERCFLCFGPTVKDGPEEGECEDFENCGGFRAARPKDRT